MHFLSAFLIGAAIIAAMWLQASEANSDAGNFCPLGFERGEFSEFLVFASVLNGGIFQNFENISLNRCKWTMCLNFLEKGYL